MASPSNNEQDEVRELLSQHRDGIARELRTSRMIAVLLDTDVLTAKDRLAICGDDEDDHNGNDHDDGAASPANVDGQCANLIDFVARHGFEKFKQFCYAIEAECPQLIADLINDRLKYGECDVCVYVCVRCMTTSGILLLHSARREYTH